MLLALLASCGSPEIALGPEAPSDPVPVNAPEQTLADWVVDCNGGGDFTTIADAIDAASDNEWILVEPCTYDETVNFNGKSVWISSSAGPESTIIDAGGDYGVVAARGEGDGAALVGFTIENAGASYGAVYASLAALRLEDVVISGARGGYFVIYGASADLEMVDVSIEDSSASYYTIYMARGAFVIDGLTAACTGNSYAFHAGHGSFFVDHSELNCRTGYALYNENSVGRVHRSTLVGGVYASTDEDHYEDTNRFENTVVRGNISQTYGTLIFRNSILDGGSITGLDIFDLELQASVFMNTRCAFTSTWSGEDTTVEPELEVEHNDFFGLATEGCDGTQYSGSNGNIAADPEFTDAEGGDYSTSSSSPLVDAGLPDDEYDDPDGSPNDIGLYGGPRSIGGGW